MWKDRAMTLGSSAFSLGLVAFMHRCKGDVDSKWSLLAGLVLCLVSIHTHTHTGRVLLPE